MSKEDSGVGFSVIIPVHDGELTIEDTIRSVLMQSQLVEVLVVDDGSADKTLERVHSLRDQKIKFFQQAQAGPSAARNAGAERASGSHLLFLDADDELLPNALASLSEVHIRGHRLARSGALVDDGVHSLRSYLALPSVLSYPRGAPLAGTFSIERLLFNSLGGYDEAFWFGENSDLLFRAQLTLRNLAEAPGFTECTTLRQVRQPYRAQRQYEKHTLNAAVMMLDKHGDELRRDVTIYANHHAVASHHYRRLGRRRLALTHAFAAARACPASLRSWARVGRVWIPTIGGKRRISSWKWGRRGSQPESPVRTRLWILSQRLLSNH